MALSKQKKKEVIDSLSMAIKTAASVVFVNFHGMHVNDETSMRRALRAEGVTYTVAKKRLLKKSLEGQALTGDLPSLEGELGVAYGADMIAPARGVYQFQKSLDNKVSILGGIFEGKFLGKEEMTVIAQIPSQKTLYAQFVNLINSPIQGLVIALDGIASKKQ
ncbi:MAG: 50S ribosomal protein L10 [Patescibacteria group bacterium]|nr:50S ribosomal protein L10 [bacterium]MDZ4240810.1 50S ribosomal protein L10 [Patescibacteria group bacterium]